MGSDELGEIRRGRAIRKQMCQSVGTRFNGVARVLLRADVDYGNLASFVGSINQCLQCFLAERGAMSPVGAGIVDHDLDVIGSLGNSGVDPGLSLGGGRKRGDLNTIFRSEEHTPELQ